MSSREAPTCFSLRTAPRATALAVLLLVGCAVGVDGTDDDIPLVSTPGTVLVDGGLTPSGPVFDAGPTFAPLPPSLSTPQEASVPPAPVREAGTRTPTGTGRTGSDAGGGSGVLGGGARGGTTSGTASGGTTSTGCNALRCTNDCSLAGPIPCCTVLDTCGCTWAPGAYCF